MEPSDIDPISRQREPVIVAGLYSRSPDDNRTTATLQMETEIGPFKNLYAPTAVMQELLQWQDAYRRLMYFYLNNDDYSLGERQARTGLPLHFDERAIYEPKTIELDDPRPVIQSSDGHFDGIRRRRVNHIVKFDVPEDAHDDNVIRSAFVHLARDLTVKLKDWYKNLQLPVRQAFTIEEWVEGKERVKKELMQGTIAGTPLKSKYKLKEDKQEPEERDALRIEMDDLVQSLEESDPFNTER